ncbi:MAG: copper amine oxidase N-terminal domain-containing protein [Acidobacteriota bacterium]
MVKKNVRVWLSGFLTLVLVCGLGIFPALAADTVQTAITWTGTWDAGSAFGTINLTQNGTTVAGTYTQNNGKILGSVSGSQLTATWSKAPSYNPPNDSGLVMLVMSVDGKTATGVWSYGASDTRQSFTATRTTVLPSSKQEAKVTATVSASQTNPYLPITITYDITPDLSGDYYLCFGLSPITTTQLWQNNQNTMGNLQDALGFEKPIDISGAIRHFTSADLVNGHFKGQATVIAPYPTMPYYTPQQQAQQAAMSAASNPINHTSTPVNASYRFTFVGPKQPASGKETDKKIIDYSSVTVSDYSNTQARFTSTPPTGRAYGMAAVKYASAPAQVNAYIVAMPDGDYDYHHAEGAAHLNAQTSGEVNVSLPKVGLYRFLMFDKDNNLLAASPVCNVTEQSTPPPSQPPATTGGSTTGTKSSNIISLGVGSPNMNINGTGCAIDPGKGTSPTVVNGRVFLPIRSIAEVMGGTVQWDAGEKRLTVITSSTTIELWIGRNVARVNGQDKSLGAAPFVSGSGRTMLPLRFVTDNLGCQTNWNPSTRSVTITFDGPVHLPSQKNEDKGSQSATGIWSGTWDTNLGTVTLTQQGSKLTGTSDDGTKLTGTASGDTAQGTWTDEDGNGTFVFTMAPDLMSFTGDYTTQGDDETYEWNGTKK